MCPHAAWKDIADKGGVMSRQECCCDVIAKTRKDERSRWRTPYFSEEYHRGYREGQADAGVDNYSYEQGANRERELIADQLDDYAKKTHNPHDSNYACMRCDIVAVVRHLSQVIRRGDIP